ncbi:NAD(P)-dependent oxidoreductase [Saccharothrix coeruleofusca]|uniref:NAD(P)-dependent oxidoreductase n=1 Tax=Saccharothrix coeruleofusca TaxID=33919 RepID=UPI0027DE66F5|nr:NAD(P)H-binding protein [Saccharothrix coeruleofusca]
MLAEARRRGHEVTPVARSPREGFALGAADDVADVRRLSAGRDVVISATRPPAGRERDLAATAEALLAGVGATRLLVVGGASSLRTPNGVLVQQEPDFPPELRPIALACTAQLEVFLRDESDVDWTYLSPPAELVPGPRTGRYRSGRDDLVVDAGGRSRISLEDLAVALLDEAERPRHRRARFTVGY